MRSRVQTSSFGGFLRLLLLCSVELAMIPALVRLGSLRFLATPGTDLAAWRLWLSQTALADALAAVARLLATGGACWLLASTAAYLIARLAGAQGLLRALSWTTPLPVRRLIDHALAWSIAASIATGGIAYAATPSAQPTPSPSAAAVSGQPGVPLPGVPLPGVPLPPEALVPQPGRTPNALPSPTAQAVPQSHPSTTKPPGQSLRRVAPGDNLWSISATELAQRSGRQPPNPALCQYWQTVVKDNRSRIRSGDPNLIFPGEEVVLPPPGS